MIIIRAASSIHTITIPAGIVRDARLSYKARGVLIRLLSNDEGTSITAEALASESPGGRDGVLTALRELRVVGYLVTKRVQEHGLWATVSTVYDTPRKTQRKSMNTALPASAPESGFPKSDFPHPVKDIGERNLLTPGNSTIPTVPDPSPTPPESDFPTIHSERIVNSNPTPIVPFPSWLDLPAWEAWVAYRRELRKPLKPSTVKLQIRFLSVHQADHVEIIQTSIRNGWTGLFPLKRDSRESAVERVTRHAIERVDLSQLYGDTR